jgi:N-acetylglucosamine-6-phosphate deacetylase
MTPSPPRCLHLRGGRVVSPGEEFPDTDLIAADGVIRTLGRGLATPADAELLDVSGHLVLPGFIDLHTHGAAGASAMDGTEEAVRAFAAAKLREGVTQFLPTTWTAPFPDLEQAFRGIAAYRQRPDHARVPGVHVEGPFLNPKCVGAQNPAFVRPPDISEIDRLLALAPVRIVSVAVEMPGGVEFVRQARERGIVASLAHTAATYEDFLAAKAAGLTHLTHFGNQMTPLHHRAIGIVGAGFLDDDIRVELIADGIHLSPDMLRLVGKVIPPERLLLITDSISASGQPDGTYLEGGQPVVVRDGICRLGNGALAGSTVRMDRALATFRDATGLPLSRLVAATSWNQARSLGLEGFGKIEPGFHADLVVLHGETLAPLATVVAGRVRWRAEAP